jgi:hypothetical protein
MVLQDGRTNVRSDALCPTGAWPTDLLDDPRWRSDVKSYRQRWDEYAEVVDRWNLRVNAGGRRYMLPEFFDYLVNTYDESGG